MGRPLRADLLTTLKLRVVITGGASKTLVKQVGYNKYLAKATASSTEDATLVRLVDKASSALEAGEGLLVLTDGNTTYNVTKVTKNVMTVAKDEDASYAYSYDSENEAIVFAKSGVSVAVEPAEDEEDEEE